VRPAAWGVAINSATGLVAAGTADGQVVVWNLASGRRQFELRPGSGWVRSVVFTPGGDQLIASGAGGIVRTWDTRTGDLLRELPTESRNTVLSLAISPNGERLAASGVDGMTTIWDLSAVRRTRRTGNDRTDAANELVGGAGVPVRLPTLAGHTDWVWSAAFGPDNRTLVTGGGDEQAIMWDVDGLWGRRLATSGRPNWAVAIDPDQTVVATAGQDDTAGGVVRVRDIASGALLSEIHSRVEEQARSIAFGEDGTTLVMGGSDGSVTFWDWRAQAVRSRSTEHGASVTAMARARDGRTLATVSCDQRLIGQCKAVQVLIWDLQTAEVRQRLSANVSGEPLPIPWSIALSPDGKFVAAGIGYGRITVWPLDGGATATASPEPIASMTGNMYGQRGHRGEVWGLTFSPEGSTLASAGADGRVILWDVPSWGVGAESLVGTGRTIWDVAYQPPSGMLLAIANGDGTVSLRDARSGDRIGPFLHNHEDGVRAVAFSSDGALLASTGVDGRVVLWDTSPEGWEARACGVASRNLTLAEWRRYLGQRPYQRTCPDLPDGNSE
jgi:WD40 repeat protein